MFGLGTGELLFIFLVVLLIFGGKKIPEVARGLGKGLREFRRARDELHDTIEAEGKLDEAAKPTTAKTTTANPNPPPPPTKPPA